MLTRTEMLVLRALCNNSRASVSDLSKKLGISRYFIGKYIASLEEKLGLKYTLELDYKLLGFSSMHVMYLNFSKKPRPEVFDTLIPKSIRIQFFATTKGDFDTIAFAVSKNPIEYSQLEVALQASLIDYGAEVHSAEVTLMRFGFVPISNALLATADGIADDIKKLLMALNENSRQELSSLSKATGMSVGMTKYYMAKLEKAGIIKRYTAVITNKAFKTAIAAFVSYHVTSGIEERIAMERRNLYFAEPKEPYAANSLLEMWSISGAAQAFILAGFNSEKDANAMINKHNSIYAKDKPSVATALITKTHLGFLPFRNMNVEESYDTTSWTLDLL
ncbi:MAG: winged helix-turn-helix transcriptional regulator [Conexivisphaerales archaeon]